MRERNNVPPLKIDSADFSKNLGMYSRNSEHTEQFLASGIEDYHIDGYVPPANYSLVKSLFEDQYRIVTTDEGKPYTAYAVKLVHHREITYPHSAVTQVMVWRTPSSRHYSAIQGFAKLFFRHLLDITNIVVSDSEQTGDGQRFWLDMLDWAYNSGYSLYVADGTEGEDWPKFPITSLDELEKPMA
ncbi:Uncharacterised protein [Cedecea neteri]|uniref:Phage protein n=1 Tax=Cedecea neteri TaxID=158822 RepID=A0A2X3KWL4_9ENTR|nr:Uncharacterised protein [Cedecea neteri]